MSGQRARRSLCLAAVTFTGLSLHAMVSAAQSWDWRAMVPGDTSALGYAVVMGSDDGLPLYACRAAAGAGVHPGRFRADFDGCHIGFGGREVSVSPFEVLVSVWQDDANGAVPSGSFRAGQLSQIGLNQHFDLSPLFPCHALYQGSLQVGNVGTSNRGCSFGYGGRQVTELKYQVMWDAPWLKWSVGIPRQIPTGALPAGQENGELFYICRAGDETGLHAGKIKASSPGCSFPSDGKEKVAPLFAILTANWMAGNAGTLPIAALPVGYEHAELLYLCRAEIHGTVQIGKFTEELASCHVGMLGGEAASLSYEILTGK